MTTCLLNGSQVVTEDANDTPNQTLYGPGTDHPLARNGEFFLPNHESSTTGLTDGGGNLTQSYLYGPFGELLNSPADSNPFQYTGRENDGDGLLYYRARAGVTTMSRITCSPCRSVRFPAPPTPGIYTTAAPWRPANEFTAATARSRPAATAAVPVRDGGLRAPAAVNSFAGRQGAAVVIYSTAGVAGDGRGGFGWAKRELSVRSEQTLNPGAPAFGKAGNLLIGSYGDLLWVGIDDPAVARQAAALAAQGANQWVLGHIVPEAGQRHGFSLDPATLSRAEVTAEGIQTTVEQVSRRLAFYAPGGPGGFDTGALSGRLLQFVPAP